MNNNSGVDNNLKKALELIANLPQQSKEAFLSELRSGYKSKVIDGGEYRITEFLNKSKELEIISIVPLKYKKNFADDLEISKALVVYKV